jgi:hypothetical protein
MPLATARQVFGFSHFVITRNLDGLDHGTSLVSPGGANCANWVLGHILNARGVVHELLGQPPVLAESEAAPYRRGSRPGEQPAEAWLALEDLAGRLDLSQARLFEGFDSRSAEQWQQILSAGPFENRSLRELVVFFALHESYHAGQLGLLRQPLGLSGAIA